MPVLNRKRIGASSRTVRLRVHTPRPPFELINELKMAKQVCDLKPSKGMTRAQSNEHLRIAQQSAYNKQVSGTQDPTREHLNFEIDRGGVVKEVDKDTSIPTRIREILKSRGITDPNAGLSEDDPRRRRTVANIILEGSRDVMRQLAFGNQEVNFKRGSDNSQVTRCPGIEKWAQDMYHFMADKYGEDNIAAFVVHLDETYHISIVHCYPSQKRTSFPTISSLAVTRRMAHVSSRNCTTSWPR